MGKFMMMVMLFSAGDGWVLNWELVNSLTDYTDCNNIIYAIVLKGTESYELCYIVRLGLRIYE